MSRSASGPPTALGRGVPMKTVIFGFAVLMVVIVMGFFIGGAFLSSDYSVTRSLEIDATPEQIYSLIGHVDTWPQWSAWNTKTYPDLKYEFPGKTEGVGAIQKWTMERGTGQLEITSAESTRGISYELVFEGMAPSEGIIELTSLGEKKTQVTWTNRGTLEGTSQRWLGLMMDSMMGQQFEQGLTGIADLLGSAGEPKPENPAGS